jgi:hypothetical protein
MTGPQSVLPAFEDHQDDAYGERTGAWIRGVQQDHANIAAELVAEQGGKAPAPGHARRRGARSWFRRYRPGPVASGTAPGRLYATAPADEPTVGHVALEHLQHGAAHDGPPAVYSESWGPWDEPGGLEPLAPAYVPDLSADLAENPDFREALRMHTRNSARQCRCGCQVDGDTWGERMVRSAIHVLRSDTAAVAFAWPTAAPQAAAEVADIEAYEAQHPVPAAPEQAGTEDVTA